MSMRNNSTPKWVAVTPSDTGFVDFQGIMATVTGDIAVQGDAGTTITMPAVPAYTPIPGVFVRVMATGTTATVLGAKAY